MNGIKNMMMRFLNIYILSHVIYYIPPLTIIIDLAVKAVVFPEVGQTFRLFHLDLLLHEARKLITSCLKRWKEKHKYVELITTFKYTWKSSPLKAFYNYCWTHIKTARFVVPLSNDPWKMESFWWTANPS